MKNKYVIDKIELDKCEIIDDFGHVIILTNKNKSIKVRFPYEITSYNFIKLILLKIRRKNNGRK